MKIALAQINVTVGDIDGNLKRCLKAAADAKGADVVVFPELAITGYPPEDLVSRPDFVDRARAAVTEFAAVSPCSAVIGYVDRCNRMPANAAAYVRNGAVEAVYHKRLLPNYGVFDEERYFKAGDKDVVILVNGVPCGITICEDIWFAETTARLSRAGVKAVLNLSASPYHAGKGNERETMLREHAQAPVCGLPTVILLADKTSLCLTAALLCSHQTGLWPPDFQLLTNTSACCQPVLKTLCPLKAALLKFLNRFLTPRKSTVR